LTLTPILAGDTNKWESKGGRRLYKTYSKTRLKLLGSMMTSN